MPAATVAVQVRNTGRVRPPPKMLSSQWVLSDNTHAHNIHNTHAHNIHNTHALGQVHKDSLAIQRV
ncbi:hypothetical protein RvY_00369 [Ramazzottius varieornatus]|uniref:Uncharacterized protein n=1 Tax=Ramazzottius varieornatus TaxID=947166 RepID=A0A1D1UCJ5_RAMVA|nr:hypothetical protein RvY_00369 [Ramazzottius varieornatus]